MGGEESDTLVKCGLGAVECEYEVAGEVLCADVGV